MPDTKTVPTITKLDPDSDELRFIEVPDPDWEPPRDFTAINAWRVNYLLDMLDGEAHRDQRDAITSLREETTVLWHLQDGVVHVGPEQELKFLVIAAEAVRLARARESNTDTGGAPAPFVRLLTEQLLRFTDHRLTDDAGGLDPVRLGINEMIGKLSGLLLENVSGRNQTGWADAPADPGS